MRRSSNCWRTLSVCDAIQLLFLPVGTPAANWWKSVARRRSALGIWHQTRLVAQRSNLTTILLVGTNAPALEGLAQTLSAVGYKSQVSVNLHDARDLAMTERPLIAVVERSLASASGSETLWIPLASGGAIVLFRTGAPKSEPLSPSLQRAVLADLSLPLERNRLIALIQHVEARARAAGRLREESPERNLNT